MRFAIIARILKPEYNGFGIQTQLLGLLRSIMQVNPGHELVLIVEPGQVLPPDLSGGEFKIVPLPPRTDSVIGRLWWDHVGVGMLCRQLEVDALYGPAHVRPLYAPCPSVVMVPDMIYHRSPEQWAFTDQFYFRLAVSLLTTRATQIIALSQSTRRDMHQFLNVLDNRITVVYPGVPQGFRLRAAVETTGVRAKYHLGRPFVLYAGSSHPRKNLAGLIAAFERVAAEVPHDLILVGPSAWTKQADADRIEHSPFPGRIRRLGIVPTEDLQQLYSQADLFVLPSLFEGFGFPVLEALACGCPTITTDVSSLPEVAGEAALLVPPGDTTALAAAMRRVLTDDALRRQLRRAGPEQARRFSWDQTARQTLALLERAAMGENYAANS